MSDFGKFLPYIIGGVVGAAASSLLSGGKKQKQQAPAQAPAQAPVVEPPPEMPSPDDARARAIQRKSIAEQRRRLGRASTILTDQTEKLGG